MAKIHFQRLTGFLGMRKPIPLPCLRLKDKKIIHESLCEQNIFIGSIWLLFTIERIRFHAIYDHHMYAKRYVVRRRAFQCDFEAKNYQYTGKDIFHEYLSPRFSLCFHDLLCPPCILLPRIYIFDRKF